ncbi:HlyD family secretion protein [Leptospira inadai serovar Lyme str. 10]|uniref:HlyD family secretion protein n=2 Tax=Leptospira inadai serovar Lyme TaxID=293084 RepID=V6HAU3_9LEPT|nr:efflux RND transporter periplasmic adaptor subunit [Leptospira inadai]EQA36626.1 HlyD family secretion protein [Leptospira inadai serovar Lyme str. 10]PNV75679.1 efflux transporter periplasmic adaptor subunit [Leptospira inadai serovar Lyme]
MKFNLSKKSRFWLTLLVLAGIGSVASLGIGRGQKKNVRPPGKPIVSENGERIEFKENSPGLAIIKTMAIGQDGDFVNVEAPARLIATMAPSVSGEGERIVLFESAELNDLYVGYIHSKNSLNRSRKNLARIQDMFKHRVATEKDLVEAETNADNDAAELAEFEGKLRAVGLNPAMLGKSGPKTAWIMCDVPESQLQNLKKGKRVKVKFSSFPDKEWIGVAEALGDNVDPFTRTVKVRIEIMNDGFKLKPGMYAIVKFPEETSGDSVVLPFNSIITVEGKNYVFVEESPGEFFRREVILGISSRERVNVLEGLTRGDRVVVEGAILLKGLSFGF